MNHSIHTFDFRMHREVSADATLERLRQHTKYGIQELPDGTGNKDDQARLVCVRTLGPKKTFRAVLDEEVKEAFAESDASKLEIELLQVAATAMQWVEKLRREKKRKAQSQQMPIYSGDPRLPTDEECFTDPHGARNKLKDLCVPEFNEREWGDNK